MNNLPLIEVSHCDAGSASSWNYTLIDNCEYLLEYDDNSSHIGGSAYFKTPYPFTYIKGIGGDEGRFQYLTLKVTNKVVTVYAHKNQYTNSSTATDRLSNLVIKLYKRNI